MAETNKSQKILRTIAWGFSIAQVVSYGIGAISMLIATIVLFATIVDADLPPQFAAVYLPVLIIMFAWLAAGIVFLVLNGKSRKDTRRHIALGVLQIIFGSVVSGILMLVSGGDSKPNHKQ